MGKEIIVEQALHGYSNGHHLLAASTQLSKMSQKTMLVLSDLSGNDIYPEFSEYLTGYPLANDGYYALAKTWYAFEKERPGCVWTHTLLIRFSDILKISNGILLTDRFKKPQHDNDVNDYNKGIHLYLDSYVDNIRNNDNIELDRFRFLMWSIYCKEQPVLLPSHSSRHYENFSLLMWLNQWSGLQRNFAFCTGSLSNRKYGDKTFDLQVVPEDIVKSISRFINQPLILDEYSTGPLSLNPFLSQYPMWVARVTEEILYEPNGKFREFLEDFGTNFDKRKYFSKLAQLYTETDAKNGIKTIDGYFTTVNTIFGENDFNLITDNILKHIFNSFSNESFAYSNIPSFLDKWFPCSDVSSFLQELSSMQNLRYVPCDESQLKFQLESLWKFNENKAKKLFKSLISKDLTQFGELLLKEYSQLIKPEQLPKLTDMDLGACNVLVSLNPEFALCSEIWQQSRNFQCEIIDCINKKSLNNALIQKIIETILENSSEVLFEQVFGVFGEISINIFLDWCRKTTEQQERKIKAWMEICRFHPEVCIKWISSNETLDINLLISIISVLDPYSEPVRQHGIKPWIRIFEHLNRKSLSSRFRLSLAQFFLPLILMSNETVSDDFMEFSFYPIQEELAKSQFEYEQWIKLESLLPSLPWYNSWDKCKRLREAIKKKGYVVQQYQK